MDKNTLSNYGWVVIAVLVLAVMIALATPFGEYIKAGVESTTAGLFDTSEKALNVVGMSANTPIDHNGATIPEGATYTKADGTVLNAGDSFPETTQPLDAYRYGDYTYVYSADYSAEPYTELFNSQFYDVNYNGWLVTIRQETDDGTYYGYMLKKNEYGAILESINGQPVTDMYYTFRGCTSLTTAPAIPSSVTDMTNTFSGCTALTTAPAIPSSVTDMSYTFYGCTSLTTAPIIPNSVTDMVYAFMDCPALTTAPEIPSSVTNMYGTFYGCTSLTTAPVIPNSVTNMHSTFMSCTALTTAPEIPSSVKYMSNTFRGCTSLTGTITINANPTNWTQCLYNTKITAVVGDTTMAASILKTKTSTAINPTA